MKKITFALIFIFSLITAIAQNDITLDFTTVENDLNIALPKVYKAFSKEHIGSEDFEYYFRVDIWNFWPLERVREQTLEMRKKGILKDTEVAFANWSDQTLYFKLSDAEFGKEKIFLIDEEGWQMFFAYSMSEIVNFETREELIEGIENDGYKNQDLSPILDCPGSLFWYAFELNTSEYDDDFSLERNAKALEIFKTIAAKGHPDAAHEMANHYYFAEDTDVEKTIEWYKKSIEFGSLEDHYELADFILDYKEEAIEEAIASFEFLIENNIKKEMSLFKLSRIYMRGTGGRKDYKKGIEYVTQSVELYDDYLAKSDLAFYYYKAMGVDKDVQKAYDLLYAANEQAKEKWGEGEWDLFLDKLKKELEE